MTNTNDKNVIKLTDQQQQVLQQLTSLVDQGKRIEEQVAPLLAIERGKLAEQLRQVIGGMILHNAGRAVGKYELASDCSTITVLEAEGSVVPMMPMSVAAGRE